LDVGEMKHRASLNRTFCLVDISPTTLILSYKGEKEKSAFTDIYGLVFRTPEFIYRSRTWSYLDLLNSLKKDVSSSVWKQSGSLVTQILTTARKPHRVMDRLQLNKPRSHSKLRNAFRAPLRLGSTHSTVSDVNDDKLSPLGHRIDSRRTDDEDNGDTSDVSGTETIGQRERTMSKLAPSKLFKLTTRAPTNSPTLTLSTAPCAEVGNSILTEEPTSYEQTASTNISTPSPLLSTPASSPIQSSHSRSKRDNISPPLSDGHHSTSSIVNKSPTSIHSQYSNQSHLTLFQFGKSHPSPSPTEVNEMTDDEKARLLLGPSAGK